MEWKRYIAILKRWLWLLVIAAVMSAAIGWAFVASGNRAQSSILIYVSIAALLGFAWAMAGVFGIEYATDNIRVPEDVDGISSVPLLGVVPTVRKGSRSFLETPGTEASTVYRNAASSILPQSDSGHYGRTILVCSAHETPLSAQATANLGMSFARLGHPTLLIDADRMHGQLTRALNLQGQPGFADALSNPSSDVMLHLLPSVPNMYVLPAGASPSVEPMTFSMPYLRTLVERSGAEGSMIMLAGPPAAPSALVALGLAKSVHEVVLVAVKDETKRRTLKRSVQSLQQSGAHLSGILLMERPASYKYDDMPAPAAIGRRSVVVEANGDMGGYDEYEEYDRYDNYKSYGSSHEAESPTRYFAEEADPGRDEPAESSHTRVNSDYDPAESSYAYTDSDYEPAQPRGLQNVARPDSPVLDLDSLDAGTNPPPPENPPDSSIDLSGLDTLAGPTTTREIDAMPSIDFSSLDELGGELAANHAPRRNRVSPLAAAAAASVSMPVEQPTLEPAPEPAEEPFPEEIEPESVEEPAGALPLAAYFVEAEDEVEVLPAEASSTVPMEVEAPVAEPSYGSAAGFSPQTWVAPVEPVVIIEPPAPLEEELPPEPEPGPELEVAPELEPEIFELEPEPELESFEAELEPEPIFSAPESEPEPEPAPELEILEPQIFEPEPDPEPDILEPEPEPEVSEPEPEPVISKPGPWVSEPAVPVPAEPEPVHAEATVDNWITGAWPEEDLEPEPFVPPTRLEVQGPAFWLDVDPLAASMGAFAIEDIHTAGQIASEPQAVVADKLMHVEAPAAAPGPVEREIPVVVPQAVAVVAPVPPVVPEPQTAASTPASTPTSAPVPVPSSPGLMTRLATIIAMWVAARRLDRELASTSSKRRKPGSAPAAQPIGTRLKLVGARVVQPIAARRYERARRASSTPSAPVGAPALTVASAAAVSNLAASPPQTSAGQGTDLITTWLKSAEHARSQGNLREAKELINRVLDRDPRNEAAWHMRLQLADVQRAGPVRPAGVVVQQRSSRLRVPAWLAVLVVLIIVGAGIFAGWLVISGQGKSPIVSNPGQVSTPTTVVQASPTPSLEDTTYDVSGAFLTFWGANGGAKILGNPISPRLQETAENGTKQEVQYFERARLELHPENKDPNAQVLLGRIGTEVPLTGTIANPLPDALNGNSVSLGQGDTKFDVPQPFYDFWKANNGPVLFGYPLTPVLNDVTLDGKPVLVQYFERARLEYHPEASDTADRVQLTNLGSKVYALKHPH